LKKHIYQLEKQQHGHERLHVDADVEAGERTSLLEDGESLSGTDAVFVPLLDRELKKIELFYEHQAKELVEDLQDLERDIALQDEVGLRGGTHYDDYDGASDDGEGDDDSISRSPDTRRRSLSRHRKQSSAGRRTSGA
jgi:phosphate transporter